MNRKLLAIALASTLALAACHDENRYRPISSGGGQEDPVADPTPVQPIFPPVESIADGPGGFVYKPESDGDGNLVVLLPATSPEALVAMGSEVGDFAGRTNGDRPTYRFNLPGAGYPPGTVLTIGSQRFTVSSPGVRVD